MDASDGDAYGKHDRKRHDGKSDDVEKNRFSRAVDWFLELVQHTENTANCRLVNALSCELLPCYVPCAAPMNILA